MKHEIELEPSRLQRDLLPRIVGLLRREAETGGVLTEVTLAERLQVSRTPVRAALARLAERGVITRRPRQGIVLTGVEDDGIDDLAEPEPSELDRLFLAIARDRMAGRLPTEASEADLMRRYDVTRSLLLRVLAKMTEVALVERKPGHGWHFLSSSEDPEARAESYRYRRIIEPAALLEPGFRLDAGWAAEMRRRHEVMIAAPWREDLSIALFEMNADFHAGLAAASGNRYLDLAVQQQNRLRRFANYAWAFGVERVAVSCREHLEILDRLERGERDIAALLMRRHLDVARDLPRLDI